MLRNNYYSTVSSIQHQISIDTHDTEQHRASNDTTLQWRETNSQLIFASLWHLLRQSSTLHHRVPCRHRSAAPSTIKRRMSLLPSHRRCPASQSNFGRMALVCRLYKSPWRSHLFWCIATCLLTTVYRSSQVLPLASPMTPFSRLNDAARIIQICRTTATKQQFVNTTVSMWQSKS